MEVISVHRGRLELQDPESEKSIRKVLKADVRRVKEKSLHEYEEELEMAKNRGADFVLGKLGEKEPQPTHEQLDEVERYFDRAAANAGMMADGVGAAVKAIGALLNAGLTRKAICLLVQGTFGKGPGGKPKYSIETIDDILSGLEGLSEYLEHKR